MHYIISLFLVFSSSFLAFNSEQGDPMFTAEQLTKYKALIEQFSEEDIAAVDAALIYKQKCSSCHGRKGGLGLAGATNLKTSALSLEERVATVYFGKNKMQSYKEALKKDELVAVSVYLESLRK